MNFLKNSAAFLLLSASTSVLSSAAVTIPQIKTDTIVKKTVWEKRDSLNRLDNDTLFGLDTTLDEIVVTATKKLIQSDGATLTYNVSEDPQAATDNVLEILRKIPGVTVDANEDIKVNGQSSFKIYLNGREDPMMSGDIKSILKSMPASSIKKIEVLSDPGAKYEAEGTGGILNIVTETKQKLNGYMANFNLSFNHRGGSLGAYARTKIGKVTGSARLNYYDGKIFRTVNRSRVENENFTSDTDRLRITETKRRSSFDYLGANVNMSWEPDTVNLFTVSTNVNYNSFNSPNWIKMSMTDSEGVRQWSLDRYGLSKFSSIYASGLLSYQHTFDKRDHNLILTYSYNHGENPSRTIYETSNIEGDTNWNDSPYSKATDDSYSDTHIFQVDYTNPFSSKHKLEAGAKGNFNRNRGYNAQYYGKDAGSLVADENQRMHLNQFRDILALYTSYTGNFSRWNMRVGVRYEYTHMGIKYKTPGYTDFTTILNDLVPNASATFRFTDFSNLRLAYQMRISRPGLGVLNPFRNTMTENYISYGNPDLKSEKSHNISLGYSNYGGKLTGSFRTRYFFSNNQITDIIFSKEGVINSTYANVGKYNNVSFNLNLNWTPVTDLNFSIDLDETYSHIKADSEMLKATKVNWQTNLYANIDYRFPFKLRLSGYFGYSSPWVDLQSRGSDFTYYGIGLGRSFLKNDALTINVNASNFFTPYRKMGYNQVSETARTSSASRSPIWSAGIGISWRIGALKADVKHTNASVTDEISGGAGSKGNN